jgi:hypothetical protein
MSSLYFGLDVHVFCQFKARVLAFDNVQYIVYIVQSAAVAGMSCESNSETLASNKQNTASPQYNDDISLLISQYLISGAEQEEDVL